MTNQASKFLQTLTANDGARARLVESLRHAAAELECSDSPGARIVAVDLRQVSAQLCDHVRVSNGFCRYCDAVVVEAG